jgi:DNA (cytosine-5)-methyltransferase 1
MNYLDGFSGYGGFHLGFENAGWKFDTCYFSEIDKYAIANYSYNFPNSIYAGSIDTICSTGIIKELDLFTFGWPCQDNSIAGKRKGQREGTRSGLLYEAVKIINKFKPRNFVAENVHGLLSVNEGIDIIESLEVLAYLNESCPQYDIEMQLFNTRWFLPQNRERLYFVGHLRGSGSRQVFPFGEEVGVCIGFGEIEKETYNVALTQRARQYSNWNGTFIVTTDGRIRECTPIECERLQGLPDNWTKYGKFNGLVKELSDGRRYKLCGNGVSEPVVRAIAKELLKSLTT